MNSVVIGAGFGDEGKGLITDFEARRLGSKLNVRFNGGSQAGHTVCSGNKRHVFGHVGASSFTGTNTYLSKDFIVNPLTLYKEIQELKALDTYPQVMIHPDCKITTIFDMVLNSAAEYTRAHKTGMKHGSCGMGINETITRHDAVIEDCNLKLTALDIFNGDETKIVNTLVNIWMFWLPLRMKDLDIDFDILPNTMKDIITTPDIKRMATDLNILRLIALNGVEFYRQSYQSRKIVFEGAQGLMLDEFLGEFPHVTRSMTGLPNAMEAAKELRVTEINPIYVTRAYCTRHGAGPLSNEGVKFCEVPPVDQTNVFNPHQDHIRYAPLDLIALRDFIFADIDRTSTATFKFNRPTIAVTCLDQVGDEVTVAVEGGELVTIKTTELCALIEKITTLKVSHRSYGPTANDVIYTIGV